MESEPSSLNVLYSHGCLFQPEHLVDRLLSGWISNVLEASELRLHEQPHKPLEDHHQKSGTLRPDQSPVSGITGGLFKGTMISFVTPKVSFRDGHKNGRDVPNESIIASPPPPASLRHQVEGDGSR